VIMAHEHISKMMKRHVDEKRSMHTRHEREHKDMMSRQAEEMGAPPPAAAGGDGQGAEPPQGE